MRLPTEADWEYAACAKTMGPYGSLRGAKRPNAWGLQDLLGNQNEWVADWYRYDYYQQKVRTAPLGPESGAARVMRGGHLFRVSARDNWAPGRAVQRDRVSLCWAIAILNSHTLEECTVRLKLLEVPRTAQIRVQRQIKIIGQGVEILVYLCPV